MSRNGDQRSQARALGRCGRQAPRRICPQRARLAITPLGSPDPYARSAGFARGWPVALYADGTASLTHCYGAVGVGRDMHPDTGTGGELYAIIGHATRQLDRNIAIVGRVVAGIEHLSALPRGTEAMGFYKEGFVAKPIVGSDAGLDASRRATPAFQYLDTSSPAFARYFDVAKTATTISIASRRAGSTVQRAGAGQANTRQVKRKS